MRATALAEPPARYRPQPATVAGAPDTETLPGEPAITAAWLLGRVPPAVLPWPLLRPGRAGSGPGPDIREAMVLLPSGVPASGDVEVHRTATDFARHGHTDDPRYAGLLLHLVWRDDRPPAERGGPVRLAGGGLAPTVAIETVMGNPARLEAAIARGPGGPSEPCAGSAVNRARRRSPPPCAPRDTGGSRNGRGAPSTWPPRWDGRPHGSRCWIAPSPPPPDGASRRPRRASPPRTP
ncbi:MAG: DUF2851 family protein [Chloroflexi bacterium]|nr:DUF2851 family protein [Chloroflexota bacterium]